MNNSTNSITGFNSIRSSNLIENKLLLGISVKNRLFDKNLISNFIDLAKSNNFKALIVIFDVPYAFNDAAERNSNSPNIGELKKILDIGDQKERMIQKLLIKKSARSISLKRWSDLKNQQEFKLIRNEFSTAVKNTRLKNILYNQIKLENCIKNKYFINFQIQEIPMLIYIYYVLGYNIDIYPGENFEIFNLLESGSLRNIIPYTSQLVLSKSNLTFINCLNGDKLLPPTFCISNGRKSA